MGGGRHGFLCLSKNKVPSSPRDSMTDWHHFFFFFFQKHCYVLGVAGGKKETNIFEMSAEVQTTAQRAALGFLEEARSKEKKKKATEALGIIHSIQLVPLAMITIKLAGARGPKSGVSLPRRHLRCAAG